MSHPEAGSAADFVALSRPPRVKRGGDLMLSRSLRWVLAAVIPLLLALSAHAQPREGHRLPRIDTELLDGRVVTAESLQGKVVVHMFWATWCTICLAELPDIQALHEKLGTQGLEVIALSVDRRRDDVIAFWQEHRYGFLVAMRTLQAREAFGDLTGTPTFLVSDRQGIVRARRTGIFAPGELERLIARLL